ncbi:AraC family transcriptional regulator [Nocardia sp. NPDC087230]|uniref:helix-turn-helix transcriptional regulator n=1 Tax=Nocardia sp. NPDC087230 TaxID=3364331 RepID=UPI0038179CD1
MGADEDWVRRVSQALAPVRVEYGTEPRTPGRIESHRFTGFELTILRAGRQTLLRRESAARGDELLVSIQLDGTGEIQQSGRRIAFGPGDLVVYRASESFRWAMHGDWAQVVLRLPVEVFAASPAFWAALPLHVPAAGAGEVIARFFAGVAALPRPEQAGPLAAGGLDLVRSIVAASARRTVVTQARALSRGQLLVFLRRHFTDPRLTVDGIARGCLVSRRTLHRAFETLLGTSPAAMLRRMRVRHARQLLLRDRARSVARIAEASGFSSTRQFYRVFQHETGMTPGQFRVVRATSVRLPAPPELPMSA